MAIGAELIVRHDSKSILNSSQTYLKFPKLTRLRDLLRRVSEDGSNPSRVSIDVDECGSLNAIVAFPSDSKAGVGLLERNRFRVPVPS